MSDLSGKPKGLTDRQLIEGLMARLDGLEKENGALRLRVLELEHRLARYEIGIKVDGKKGWYWAWQHASATYIAFSGNRGIAAIDQNFPSDLPNAVLVHDCWASHLRTACRTHQLCTAHLLRELVYFTERYASGWAMEFK